MTPGEHIRLTIEKPAAGGRMIARQEGAIVLVAGAIPGEVVEAVVERVQRGTVWAKTNAVIEASPDRMTTRDDGACGGNVLAHVRYERQLALKCDIIRDAFARIGRMPLPADVPIEPSPVDGYRLRARLHVRRGRIGFYREGTHELCDAAPTRQLLPETIVALARLEDAIGSMPGIDGTEVELSENVPASERAVHLQLPRPALGPQLRLIRPIAGLSGVSYSVPTALTVHLVRGSTRLHDVFEVPLGAGAVAVALERHAHAYFQGNRFLLTRLMAGVASLVPAGRVLDLYAGVGPFAMTLAARGDADIVAIEGDDSAAADLGENAIRADGRIVPRHQPVEAFLRGAAAITADSAIVDPPRTGLSKEAIGGLLALRTARLVYVSCDVATAARDARLLAEGGFRLSSMRAFDMFPTTAHVETLMLFER
jgi:23S rRNA (uracil1939-C5)-methyltransferase